MKQQDFTGRDKKPDIEINKPGDKSAWPGGRFPWFLYALLLMGTYYLFTISRQVAQEQIPYSEFLQYLEKGQVQECTVSPKVITGTLTLKDEKTDKPRHFITVPLWNNELALLLEKHGAQYTVAESNDRLTNFLLNWVLPFGVLFLLWSWVLKKMRPGGGFLNIGGNRVHIHADTGPKVTFEDVAGVIEAKQELKETIDFLEDPAEIQRLGGHMPKGVLLVGPPGTGKTLLARAVSGEAGVPFFNISGSEFIEMFVGVGAARVRDLFEQARQKAPCIIFIDELDAIGRSRAGPAMMRSNDERDQTLNQLLVELDGFDTSSGVAVMAASNRPEILDKALLRAGRFDRQVLVDKPDLEDRIAILQIHVRDLKLADDIDLTVVAQRTPGFVGADLANIANEAALHAVREHHQAIMMSDFEAAIDRVIAGPEKKHRVLSPDEKRRVAFHEAGHTLVALSVPTGEPIHKVSIIPRGIGALGYTLQLPVKEKFLQTKQELEDQIAILLGGRTAEEIVFGDISTGAQNDLEKASQIARGMVCRLGMSDKLGPLTYGEEQRSPFLDVEYSEQRNYSEETARAIDLEVKRLVDAGHGRAHEIVTTRRPALDALSKRLEQKEVIGGDEVSEVLRGLMPDEP